MKRNASILALFFILFSLFLTGCPKESTQETPAENPTASAEQTEAPAKQMVITDYISLDEVSQLIGETVELKDYNMNSDGAQLTSGAFNVVGHTSLDYGITFSFILDKNQAESSYTFGHNQTDMYDSMEDIDTIGSKGFMAYRKYGQDGLSLVHIAAIKNDVYYVVSYSNMNKLGDNCKEIAVSAINKLIENVEAKK